MRVANGEIFNEDLIAPSENSSSARALASVTFLSWCLFGVSSVIVFVKVKDRVRPRSSSAKQNRSQGWSKTALYTGRLGEILCEASPRLHTGLINVATKLLSWDGNRWQPTWV